MTQSDLPAMRQLVKNGAYSFSDHALDQMLNRGILQNDVESVLVSNTNQIVEVQSPSNMPGKKHQDERVLIFDPSYSKRVIAIIVALLAPSPEIRVVTVEYVDPQIWKEFPGRVPCLIRI